MSHQHTILLDLSSTTGTVSHSIFLKCSSNPSDLTTSASLKRLHVFNPFSLKGPSLSASTSPLQLLPQATKVFLKALCVATYRSSTFFHHITKASIFYLKNIVRFCPSLSDSVMETFIYAFITSVGLYCNGVLFVMPNNAID